MRKLLFAFVVSVLLSLTAFPQTEADGICIHAFIPETESIPAEASHNLETRLQNLVASQGIVDGQSDRFVITARIDVVNKDITQTAPPKISLKMNLTLIVGDLVDDKIYGMYTMTVAGIGDNENKAYMAAFNRLKPINKLQTFVHDTKQKIFDYYNENCSLIICDAERKAQIGQYDDAITQLITVPSVCADCYAQCQTKSLTIYERRKVAEADKLDKTGRELIRQARSLWSAKKDYESAERALEMLAQIDPDAKCVNEADALVNEISTYLRRVENQQWEFKMRQYEDNLADRRQAQADRTALLGSLINRFGRFDINIKKEKTSRWGLAKTQ